MQFLPYPPSYAKAIMAMLENHVNLAPEDEMDFSTWFKALYMHPNPVHQTAFILKEENSAPIKGFMAVGRPLFENSVPCLYIIEFCVAREERTQGYALEMLAHLKTRLKDSETLLVNVHPQRAEAMAFWEGLGYKPNGLRSVYYNTLDEQLTAFEII